MNTRTSLAESLLSGFIGAVALTVVNEVGRRIIPDAPRLDLLGQRMITNPLRKAGQTPPQGAELDALALVGDIAMNTLYFGLFGAGGNRNTSLLRGALSGLVAGLGAVVLPGRVGLGDAPSGRTTQTKWMTVAWYAIGGVVTALISRLLAR